MAVALISSVTRGQNALRPGRFKADATHTRVFTGEKERPKAAMSRWAAATVLCGRRPVGPDEHLSAPDGDVLHVEDESWPALLNSCDVNRVLTCR